MANYDIENWYVEDLVKTIRGDNENRKRIKLPQYQRSIVWSKTQQDLFIDSLKNGFPFGTLLVYPKQVNNFTEYILIDGLQRSSTIKKYLDNPLNFVSKDDISNKTIDNIFELTGFTSTSGMQVKEKIIDIILDWIRAQKSIKKIEAFHCVKALQESLPSLKDQPSDDKTTRLVNIISPFINDFKNNYEELGKTKIPIIIYNGKEENLPEIFGRLNSKGTQLNKYQVYAATWLLYGDVFVEDESIIKKVIDKYEEMELSGYEIDGFDNRKLIEDRNLNYYEYLYGFSKLFHDKYPDLVSDDYAIGFNLINSCLKRKASELEYLPKAIVEKQIDLVTFQKCIFTISSFVYSILKGFIKFRGNSRNTKRLLHSDNQIISIIASTFLECYEISDLSKEKQDWRFKKNVLKKNIPQRYIYDVISNNWSGHGDKRLYDILKDNIYMNKISRETWDAALYEWFSNQRNRKEMSKVAEPSTADILFINCIYINLFSAKDTLSGDYDIDHIIAKNKMKTLLKRLAGNDNSGLPVSSVANLCYLPEAINRKKGDNTVYKCGLNKDEISGIENKYTFTKESELGWVYDNNLDYDQLRDNYLLFLKDRFNILQKKFYKSLEIE